VKLTLADDRTCIYYLLYCCSCLFTATIACPQYLLPHFLTLDL
jgi:hypothetical protein